MELPPAEHIGKAEQRNFDLKKSLLLAELERSKAAPAVAMEGAP